jgi:hypothetical protein
MAPRSRDTVPPRGNRDPDDLLTPKEAAELARVSVRTWRRYQAQGTGPKPAGYVGRSPRWRRGDVLDWIRAGLPTGQAPPDEDE